MNAWRRAAKPTVERAERPRPRMIPRPGRRTAGHELAGAVDVGAVLEDQRADREALNRLRAKHIETWYPTERLFDWQCDQRLDLIGRESRRFGLRDDLRRHEPRAVC